MNGIGELIVLISDEMLAWQTLNGDLAAYEELVNRYKNQVYAIVFRIIGHAQEAEDLSQEVFLTVYQKIYQFDCSKRFAPWLFRIATNTSISALRKRKKVVMVNFDEAYIAPMDHYASVQGGDPHSMFEQRELHREIDEAIMALPENYRVVISLRYQMDLNNQEIAEVLGVSKENVEVKVHRARRALQKILLNRQAEMGIHNELSANR